MSVNLPRIASFAQNRWESCCYEFAYVLFVLTTVLESPNLVGSMLYSCCQCTSDLHSLSSYQCAWAQQTSSTEYPKHATKRDFGFVAQSPHTRLLSLLSPHASPWNSCWGPELHRFVSFWIHGQTKGFGHKFLDWLSIHERIKTQTPWVGWHSRFETVCIASQALVHARNSNWWFWQICLTHFLDYQALDELCAENKSDTEDKC